MKKFTIGLAAVLFVAFGCKKSSNNSSTPPGGMDASVNGQAFQASTTTGIFSASAGYIALFGIQTKGVDSSGIEVDILDTIKVGEPGLLANGFIINYGSNTGPTYSGGDITGHGVVTLSAWDTVNHTIAGTFSGVLYDNGLIDSVVVTNGTFNTSYTLTP